MTWLIDSTHTEIYFTARHLMISNVRGQFQTFSGTIDFDETRPVETTVAVQMDTASLHTGSAEEGSTSPGSCFPLVSRPLPPACNLA